jgi:hypothetical protein
MELAHDRFLWKALVLEVLNLLVLLSEIWLISKMDLREIDVRMGVGWNWLRIVSNGRL